MKQNVDEIALKVVSEVLNLEQKKKNLKSRSVLLSTRSANKVKNSILWKGHGDSVELIQSFCCGIIEQFYVPDKFLAF